MTGKGTRTEMENHVFSDIVSVGALTALLGLWWRVATWKAQMDINARLMVGALRAITSTIEDEGERRAIEATLATFNSPLRLNYAALREMTARYGKPPQHVIDTIRQIAGDSSLDESWKILGAIANAFTPEEIQRAYAIHGPDAITANKIFLMVIADCREGGTENVLRDAGLID